MAYATKYQLQFSNTIGKAIKLDIEKDAYSGSIITIEGGADALRPRMDGAEDTHDPIKITGYEITFFVHTHGDYAEFLETNDREFRVKIYTDTVLTWVGWVVAEMIAEPLSPGRYEIKITAKDGLNTLKNIEFTAGGRRSHIDMIAECLEATGLQLDIRSAININHSGHSGDPLSGIFANAELYRKNNVENWNCYDVLTDVLEIYGARIQQQGVMWYVTRCEQLYNGSLLGSTYDYTGAEKSGGSFTIADTKIIGNDINATTVSLLAGGTINKLPAMREMWIKQTYGKSISATVVNGNFNSWQDVSTPKNWVKETGVSVDRWDRGDGDYFCRILGYEGTNFTYISQSLAIAADNTSNYILKYDYALNGIDNHKASFRVQITITNGGVTYYLMVASDGTAQFVTGIVNPDYQYIKHSNIVAAADQKSLNWITNTIEIIPFSGVIIPAGTLQIKIFEAQSYLVPVYGICVDNFVLYPKVMPESKSTVYLYGQNNPNFNVVPKRLETLHGDIPDIANAKLYYLNYLSIDQAGDSPTVSWQIDNGGDQYLINEIRLRSLLNANSKNLNVKRMRIQGEIGPLTTVTDHLGVKYQVCSYSGSTKDSIYDVVCIEIIEPESNVPEITETDYPNDPTETNDYTGETGTSSLPNSSQTLTIINTALNATLPRANEQTLSAGINDIEFINPFPEGVNYVIRPYTFNDAGYQVGSVIVENSQTITGFSINASVACNLIYIATPKK